MLLDDECNDILKTALAREPTAANRKEGRGRVFGSNNILLQSHKNETTTATPLD
jgi:hypothetical protein